MTLFWCSYIGIGFLVSARFLRFIDEAIGFETVLLALMDQEDLDLDWDESLVSFLRAFFILSISFVWPLLLPLLP